MDVEFEDIPLDTMDFDIEFQGELSSERPGTPMELIAASELAAGEVLPEKSRERYFQAYNDFQKWKESNGATSNSERILMAFFRFLATKYQPTSLWAQYSMLKVTMKIQDNVDIAKYLQLTSFLKSKSSGYQPVKAKFFVEEDIRRSIDGAPDYASLDEKIVSIFAVCGACRTHELPNVKVADVSRKGDKLLVEIPITKTKVPRKIAITGSFVTLVEKYAAMRPQHAKTDRFFLNYQKGKCTIQPIGKNKFYKMPARIAIYLKLEDPKGYSDHSYRRTSASILANTGASIEMLKSHGGWSSNKVAESYVQNSDRYKKQIGDLITSSINYSGTDEPTVDSGKSNSVDSGNPNSVDLSGNLNDDLVEIALDSNKQDESPSNCLTQIHREDIQRSFKFVNCRHLTFIIK